MAMDFIEEGDKQEKEADMHAAHNKYMGNSGIAKSLAYRFGRADAEGDGREDGEVLCGNTH